MSDHVITGGPGTGKSTVIRALAELGFAVVPEAARQLIEEQQQQGGILPWTNNYEFQRLVLYRQRELESRVREPTRFLDRAICDSIGYSAFWKHPLPPDVAAEIRHRRFAKVFLLEPLPSYQIDAERKETAREGLLLRKLIEDGYRCEGYAPIIVPLFPGTVQESVDQRVKFILEHVRA